MRFVVDDLPFARRLYEIKDRTPHEPLQQEIARLELYTEDDHGDGGNDE